MSVSDGRCTMLPIPVRSRWFLRDWDRVGGAAPAVTFRCAGSVPGDRSPVGAMRSDARFGLCAAVVAGLLIARAFEKDERRRTTVRRHSSSDSVKSLSFGSIDADRNARPIVFRQTDFRTHQMVNRREFVRSSFDPETCRLRRPESGVSPSRCSGASPSYASTSGPCIALYSVRSAMSRFSRGTQRAAKPYSSSIRSPAENGPATSANPAETFASTGCPLSVSDRSCI